MQQDHLLRLIQSLTPKEKSEFKRYINFKSGGRKSNYEILFNIYSKLLNKSKAKVISRDIKKSLKKYPDLEKSLTNERRRLKEKLLDSLSIHNTEKTNEIGKSIFAIRVLLNKKLYEEAKIELIKVKKYCILYDINKYLVEILNLEMYLLMQNSAGDDYVKLKKIRIKQQHYIELYILEVNLHNLFRELNLLIERDFQVTKKETHLELQKIINNPCLTNFELDKHENQKNVHVVLWYGFIKNLYYRKIEKKAKAFQASNRLIDFFESSPKLIEIFKEEYIRSLCAFSRACSVNRKTELLERTINKVKKIYEAKGNHNALAATCDMGVIHYKNTRNYKKAEEILKLMEEDWLTLQNNSSDGKLLWYAHNNSTYYWILGNKDKFKLWVDIGLALPRANKGKTFYFCLRMLALTADFDNNELFAFKEKIEALQKTLQNNENLNDFEKTVFYHLRTFYNIEFSNKNIDLKKNKKEALKLQAFQSLKAALRKLGFKTKPINYEEILLWCESHLQNKTIKEVFETED